VRGRGEPAAGAFEDVELDVEVLASAGDRVDAVEAGRPEDASPRPRRIGP
jgi:hypothetical protein